jgi:hypothetical protein
MTLKSAPNWALSNQNKNPVPWLPSRKSDFMKGNASMIGWKKRSMSLDQIVDQMPDLVGR